MDWLSRIGNDRVVMILCAFMGITRGTAYTFQPGLTDISGHYALLDQYVPVEVYGALWYCAGVAAFVGIFKRTLVPAIYGVYIGLVALWTLVFLASWVTGVSPTGFSSVATYATITGLLYLVARAPDIEPEITYMSDEDLHRHERGGS